MGWVVEPETAARFWDARYANALVYGSEPTWVARRLVSLFRESGVRRILEAGCGSGRDALFYAREHFDVTGIDISANALRWARQQAAAEGLRLTLLRDELVETGLPPGSFDASVAVHLVHLQPASVRQAMVNQLWRLTRDAGLIVMANYSTSETGFAIWDPYPEPGTRVDPKGKLVHFFDAEEMRALLPPERFDVLSLEEIDLAETPDSGPVIHREWVSIARKVRTC